MKKEITIHSTLPEYEEFNKFKYILIIGKTTSKKYVFILNEIKKFHNKDVILDKHLYHIVGFTNSIQDLRGLYNLLFDTHNLTNISLYVDGQREETFNSLSKIKTLIDCALKASQVNNREIYCSEEYIKDLNSSNMQNIRNAFTQENEPPIKHVNQLIIDSPCHCLSYYYFDIEKAKKKNWDIKEYLKATILKHQPELFECPYFDLEKFDWEIIDEYRAT
jgi:hypothetical protein